MKKKLIPFALLFTYLLPLVGCGSKTCTITFDPNNGEEPFTMIVNKGELLTEPESPEKTAYNFKAWRYNNIKWSFKYEKVKGDMTLKAFYVPKEYSLTYDLNGGVAYDYQDFYTIESDSNPVDAKKFGYINDYFVDQDGNKLTTLKGSYGDKKLTLHWTLDSENFIEFGSAPGSIVEDDNLVAEIEQTISEPTYQGDIEYNGKKYCRRLNPQYERMIGTKRVFAGQYCIFQYEPIVWFKVETFDTYKTIYFSVYSLAYMNSGNTYYDQGAIRAYLNSSFINECFSESEKARLLDYNIDNTSRIIDTDIQGPGTVDKVFIPSYKEHSKWLPKLDSIKFYGSYYSLKHGFMTDATCVYSYTNFVGNDYGRKNYSSYYIRTIDKNYSSYCYNHNVYRSDTGNYIPAYSTFIRPCIVLGDK